MSVIKRVATGQLTDKSTENEFNNILKQVPHKDDVATKVELDSVKTDLSTYAKESDVLLKSGALTQAITIDPTKISVVTIVNGQIISWSQT